MSDQRAGEVLHIVGLDVQVGSIRRQRCSWCGALIQEDDLARMAWQLNPDGSDPGPPGCWPVGEVVGISGGFPKVTRLVARDEWTMSEVPGERRLPDGCCALLDPEVTT